MVVVSNASIKNSITTSIAHIHAHGSPVVKTIYYTVNITSTEAELFVIRYGISQAVQCSNTKYIIIITNSIYAAKRIFDSSAHSYQIHLAAISCKLRKFFKTNVNNSIEFWDCLSQCN